MKDCLESFLSVADISAVTRRYKFSKIQTLRRLIIFIVSLLHTYDQI